jgi:TRAP-type mannitol/chloroaromatic compound transport system permease small subunit
MLKKTFAMHELFRNFMSACEGWHAHSAVVRIGSAYSLAQGQHVHISIST